MTAHVRIHLLFLVSLTIPLSAAHAQMRVVRDESTGQYTIQEAERPVLRYNYQLVPLPAGYFEKVAEGNRKYARPRADYVHPLWGLDGEVLTDDFSVDHPHHRGIYWAWPEVRFGDQLGDLHALQRVFARPTGKITVREEAALAEITAESRWLWEERTPIVAETATIRAGRAEAAGRYVDFTFQFVALEEGVTLARRGAAHYGGLNVRLSPIKDLQLTHHADPPEARPRRAWSDSVGIRAGGTQSLGMAILEKAQNPYYPGDYIQYPNLPWFQPTFPATGVQHRLKPGEPLVLRYRLWIRRGGAATAEAYAREWDAYNRAEPGTASRP